MVEFDFTNNLKESIALIEEDDFMMAINKLKYLVQISKTKEQLTTSIIIKALINFKLFDYKSSEMDFLILLNLSNKEDIIKALAYSFISEIKFKSKDYKGALENKLESNKYNIARDIKHIQYRYNIDLHNKYFKNIKYINQINYRTLSKIFKINKPKYDLINDYIVRIKDKKRFEILDFLNKKSISKIASNDYKGAIISIRRFEKYL